ncbi:hypothetical protein E0H73_42890 [Kribbella pittospori]|uniref:Uncharacterized protein n=1 Tax=Kribbella pittospori TaxID=722689 RepID=A0A4R0JQ22_9ACTN|nr:hypothetical protein [Kribbella pittospori]TCC48550.1 hypothetical protein E0H73_42890 [Kribbella pittospori]
MSGALLLLLASVAIFWFGLFTVFPAASRAQFVMRMTKIRDDCDDAIIDRRLPDCDPVRDFINKANEMMKDADRLGGTSFHLAVQTVVAETGAELPEAGPSYGALDPDQRRLMNSLDERVTDALADHVIRGSSLWWFHRPVRALVRHRTATFGTSPTFTGGGTKPAPEARGVELIGQLVNDPVEVAQEYRTVDSSPILHV